MMIRSLIRVPNFKARSKAYSTIRRHCSEFTLRLVAYYLIVLLGAQLWVKASRVVTKEQVDSGVVVRLVFLPDPILYLYVSIMMQVKYNMG